MKKYTYRYSFFESILGKSNKITFWTFGEKGATKSGSSKEVPVFKISEIHSWKSSIFIKVIGCIPVFLKGFEYKRRTVIS